MKAQSAGGKATAIILRARALKEYYENPNYCKYCNSIIEVTDNMKVRYARTKQFCNKSCAAKFNNSKVHKRIKKIKVLKERILQIEHITKEELFSLRSNYQSARSAIRKHAQIIYEKSNKPKFCTKCGYSIHYQVAHIKPVSDFSNDTLISDINHIDNLIALCPNCHWEFDHLGAERGHDPLSDTL